MKLRHRCLCIALLLALGAGPIAAQISGVRRTPRNVASIFAGLYTTIDAIYDPGTGSLWHFGDNAPAAGIALHRQVVPGLLLGVEGSWARADFERRTDGIVVAAGDADLFTARATGRLQAATPGSITGYLMGGFGFFGYRVPDPETTAWDLSLSTGAGIEYRFRPATGLFLEWDRIWAYHESEGIDDNNTGRHSLLRLGLRRGF
ncbi:MAG TPA: hypothetical protein VK939_04335 [Longimicrobiales bacterium]|nr:hypothetical protein [Longimicrobiales bacterium]